MTITSAQIKSEAAVREEARKRAAALHYSTGFGNEHSSEALVGALPVGRNNPQRPAFGLYTERSSASSAQAEWRTPATSEPRPPPTTTASGRSR